MKRSITGVLEKKDDWLWGVNNRFAGFLAVDALLQEFEGRNVEIIVQDTREQMVVWPEPQLAMAAPI